MKVHKGGHRPVKSQTRVDIEFRSGVIKENVKAGHYRWVHACNSKWMTDKSDDFDIVKYRVIKPNIFQ